MILGRYRVTCPGPGGPDEGSDKHGIAGAAQAGDREPDAVLVQGTVNAGQAVGYQVAQPCGDRGYAIERGVIVGGTV